MIRLGLLGEHAIVNRILQATGDTRDPILVRRTR